MHTTNISNSPKNSWLHALHTVLLTLTLTSIALPAWAVKIKYIIVALDGTQALTLTDVESTPEATLISQMPADYKSPFLQDADYKFFNTLDDAKTWNTDNAIETVPTSAATVYVAYRYDAATYRTTAQSKGFDWVATYELETKGNKKNNEQMLYYQGAFDDLNALSQTVYSNINYVNKSTTTATAAGIKDKRLQFAINITDPYQVTVQTHFDEGNAWESWNSEYTDSKYGNPQQRDGWYVSVKHNKGMNDIRVVENLDLAKTRVVWAFAILPGHYYNNGGPDDGLFRLVVANNYMGTANSLDNKFGHYYLSNTLSEKSSYQRRNSNDDIRLYANHTFTKKKYRIEFKLKTPLTGTWLTAYKFFDNTDAMNTSITLPASFERKFVTNHTFYTDEKCTQPVTNYKDAYDASHTTLYVKYDVVTPTEGTSKFQFSTLTDPAWFVLKVANKASSDVNATSDWDRLYGKASNDYSKGDDAAVIEDNNTYWFAFVGDPYEMRVLNYKQGGTSKYLGVATKDGNGYRINVYSGANDKTRWEMTPEGAGNSFRLRTFNCYRFSKAAPSYMCYYQKNNPYPQLYYDTENQATTFLVNPITGSPRIFIIVNNSKNIALRATADDVLNAQTPAETMPQLLKSPVVKSYRFYKTEADAKEDKGKNKLNTFKEATETIDGYSCVYVRYDCYTGDETEVDISGRQPYYIRLNPKDASGPKLYVSDGSSTIATGSYSATTTQNVSVWWLSGKDPYDLKFNVPGITGKNLQASGYTNSSTVSMDATGTPFALLYGQDSYHTLAYATGSAITDNHFAYLSLNGDGSTPEISTSNTNDPTTTAAIQVQLVPLLVDCNYHIIDNSKQEAVSLLSNTRAYPLSVPSAIRSPLAKSWRFYDSKEKADDDAEGDRIENLPYDKLETGTTLELYVRYDADQSKYKFNEKKYADKTKLVGDTPDTPYYSLEFTSQTTPEIYMESDNLPTDKLERPHYIYVNGFNQYYLYGDLLHEEIFSGGKSNRTRFLWYLHGTDPYNMSIMSYQGGGTKNVFFRTYFDNSQGKVVTALTQESTTTPHEPDSTASRYMILGQDANFQLTTREKFSGQQVTVDNFEHGWRYAGERANTGNIEEIFAEKGINAHHLDFDDKHWFYTVQMGRDFKINPEELTPVLVLLDRHGWRLKYWNFSQKNDAAIKLFNSPLVTKYKWYNFNNVVLPSEVGDPTAIWKSVGFYHYMMPEEAELNVETTELSYSAWKAKGGSVANNNVNIFVTYEVDGADDWTDQEQGPDWILDQNGTLGYLAGNEIQLGDATQDKYKWSNYVDMPYIKNGEDLTTERLWLLERNKNIDIEMGYDDATYRDENDGEYFAYTDEQELFDPYNLRIKSKTEPHLYLSTVYSDGELQDNVGLTDSPDAIQTTYFEDDASRQVTGCTWMYVQDSQGKPRLVPRFSMDQSLTSLNYISKTDGSEEQQSRLTPVKKYTHIYIKQRGKDAGTDGWDFQKDDVYAVPGQPIKLQDEWRRYWCEYQYYDKAPVGSTYDEANRTDVFSYISSQVYAPYTINDIVRFSPTVEEAWWYNMGVSETPKYAQNASGTTIAAKDTEARENDEWLWGFVGNPYKFQIIRRSEDGKYVTATATLDSPAANWTAPVGLGKDATLPDGVPFFKRYDTDSFMAIAGDNLTVSSSAATPEANKITLTSQNKATFKIINLTKGLALEFKDELPPEGLALPEFVRSPLVHTTADGYRNGYNFYKEGAVTVSGDTYEVTSEAEKLPENYRPVHGETIYVTYAFNNKLSVVDLSGKGKFNLQNDTTYLYINGTTGKWLKKAYITEDSPMLTKHHKYLWRLTGEDPYNIKIYNDSLANTSLIVPNGATDANGQYMGMQISETSSTFSSYILTNGTDGYEGCYRFLAAYPKDATNNRDSQHGVFWYLGRQYNNSDNGAFLASDKETDAHREFYSNIRLIPRNTVLVTYHLTRHITGKEMQSAQIEEVCKSVIQLPPGWERKYCDYTYTSAYDIQEQSYGGTNPQTEITHIPFLISDDDNLPEIDIYVHYDVTGMPFNLILPTEHNTQEEIENLSADVFNLDTYEQRLAKGFSDTKTDGYLYYLVMNTNDQLTSGKQYFLQRDEQTGHISYLSSRAANDYDPHYDNTKNAYGWDYNRVTESYKATDHSLFRDESWLWAFAGDPYDLYVFNLEGIIEKQSDGLSDDFEIKRHPRHATGYATLTKGTTTEYTVSTTDYKATDEAFTGYRWGLGTPTGTNSSQTFSLLVNEMDSEGNFIPDGTATPRYWQMTRSANDNLTEVLLQPRANTYNGLEYNLTVLPYKPTRYEDVNLMIRRLDNIFADKADVNKNKNKTTDDLVVQESGMSELYYAASTRRFAKGDVISKDIESLPVEARRQFCEYTVYKDVYNNDGDYTVVAGPYLDDKNRVFTYVGNTKMYITKDGTQTDEASQAYQPVNGQAKPGVWPQNLYVSYVVTSDVFLKDHPTKEQVMNMANDNDHVYFMDFTQNNRSEGYDKGRHAYFDNMAFFSKDRKTKLADEGSRYETVTYDGNSYKILQQIDDPTNGYRNHKHFNTTGNRMESVPENLKWYFVGDPYKLQVYNTAGAWGNVTDGKTAANLCRFDPTESRFQYIVDCVHLRVPDKSTLDEREYLLYYEDNATSIISTGEVVKNPYYNQPIYDDFYWEVVPSIKGTGSAGKDYFALRFKRDNVQLRYKNVYYYLAGANKSKTYVDGTYTINLSYNPTNERHQSGNNKDMHSANDADCIIKLVQPAKVYVSAYKPDDQNLNDYAYQDGERVTNEELSEYFGVGETLTEVPRHLQRKFVKYGALTNRRSGLTDTKHNLTNSDGVAFNLEKCTNHGSLEADHLTWYRENAETQLDDEGNEVNNRVTKRASYKFNVNYIVDDLSSNAEATAHLFTPNADFADKNIQWLDFCVGNSNWLYYDKYGTGDDEKQKVGNYRVAVSDNTADGWNDGLKGLHWAFIGDPYDFTILNRRRYEDNNGATGNQWLAATKATIRNYNNTADSVVWLATLKNDNKMAPPEYEDHTSEHTATATENTHWSLQMWKTGSSKDYFLRTASLKTEVVNATVGDYSNDYSDDSGNRNQTNNYWRLIHKLYPDNSSNSTATSFFEMVPYSLATKSNYNSTLYDANYSMTMNGLGVTQQRTEIRTAVAKDMDKADNDCFDANVRIYTNNGLLRISQDLMELRYDDITSALPASLKRYGCNYRCYLDYNPTTGEGIVVSDFDDNDTELKDGKNFRQLVAEALAANPEVPLTVSYVYTYEDVEAFFTSEKEAVTEEYTWLNTYFNWMQKFKGTNVEREYYDRIFDHYVYNADGHIIDEVYRYVRKTEIISNADTEYETQAFLNTHTTQEPVYADEGAQSEDDRQKWALVGDPYSFTMKNYAQYVSDPKATVTIEGNRAVTTNVSALAQEFALALDENGGVFLALINDKYTPTSYLTFDYSNTSTKIPYPTGTGTNLKDPTGNTINTGGAKNFALANLLRYADLLEYHLVIAHQHSLDHTDTGNDGVNTCITNHLYEFLKYRGLYEHGDSTHFLTYYTEIDGKKKASGVKDNTTVGNLLKKYGTLRDLYTYPIDDHEMARVGIGNHPQVPWYMKRQFCTYYCYQRDVMRSVVDPDSPAYVVADDDWIARGGETYLYNGVLYKVDKTSKWTDQSNHYMVKRTFIENGEEKVAYNIKWVSVTDQKHWTNGNQPKYYDEVVAQNGKRLERLNESHYNRKVVIDVVYEVNTDQFRFADQGRNTTAWYQLMTNNDKDGLMNFSYLNGIGAQQNRSTHYTNDYLWAPEGDPYGFVLRSRYATVNGSGWDDVVVTTTGTLPKASTPDATPDEAGLTATYTGPANTSSTVAFDENIIVQPRSGESGATTDGATNAVYEMMMGSFQNSFLMRPTAAWTDINDSEHESYYMTHILAGNITKLIKATPSVLMTNADANWRLLATTSQLLPYFQRAGYVGGLQPLKAQDFDNEEIYNQLRQHDKAGTQPTFTLLRKAQELVYTPANLVALGGGGYYRIAGFSTVALNMAEGATGIQGQRYVSGYRFLSETGGETPENAKPLRFFETAKDNATIHTFADLATAKGFSDATPGSTVLQGNIELLPADFDPSSIFHFEPVTGGVEGRYTLSTQGLKVSGVSGVSGYSRLSGTPGDATPLRIDDIGGAAVTLRILGEGTVGTHIKTNYLNSNGDSYALTFTNNNELNETPSGIQDTKWLLQPVGVKENWPYNQMPLRVEVHPGGVKDQKLTGVAPTAPENKDPYYYGTLYVPFDTRLQSTIDAAFTLVVAPTSTTEKVTMQSVSQYNGMGNPQYVPATWPVVLRTSTPGRTDLKNRNNSDYATKHYVNMYLPYSEPQTVAHPKNQLSGEYLEQSITTDQRVMVFGRPYKDHANPRGSDADAAHHQYDDHKQVGWYSNDNWARENYSNYSNYRAYSSYSPATIATDAQRSNKYVYHNRVYLLISEPAPSRHIVALFDAEDEPWQEDRPIDGDVTGTDVPWPCDVYDLQGRRVAENETPQTLRKNHPHLRKGVYIFGGHKVVVR